MTTPLRTSPHSTSRNLRDLLWLCTGAALAIAAVVIVTSAWSADAAPGDDDTTFVPTPGCRLLDTRPGADNVGPRSTPLGPNDTFNVQVRGDNGRCTGPLAIPADATGVALNATAVGATSASNIRLYPANLTEPPLLSNLNVTAGAPATPNKVDVQLSPDGAINAFNFKGQVHLVLDVVGYYTTSSLSELDQRLRAIEAASAQHDADIDELGAAQPFAMSTSQPSDDIPRSEETVVVGFELSAPVDGHVTATSSLSIRNDVADTSLICSIATDDTIADDFEQRVESPGVPGDVQQLAGTRRVAVAGGDTVSINLVCRYLNTIPGPEPVVVTATDIVLTAIFTPVA